MYVSYSNSQLRKSHTLYHTYIYIYYLNTPPLGENFVYMHASFPLRSIFWKEKS